MNTKNKLSFLDYWYDNYVVTLDGLIIFVVDIINTNNEINVIGYEENNPYPVYLTLDEIY
jgi:hypothetical protein